MSSVSSRPALCIGGSTFSFIWKEHALTAMEKLLPLGLNDFDVLMVPGHLWIDEFTPESTAKLRRDLDSRGIRIDSLNLPALDLNLCSCVGDVRAYSISVYRKALQCSADLGGRALVVVPGRVSALLAPDKGDTMGWLNDSIAALLKTAERLDQRLYLELHPQTPIPTSPMIGAFVDQFNSPRVTIAYDIASAEFIGEDYVAEISRLGHRIGQFHLSDSTRSAWRHDALGEGTVDVPASLKAIQTSGASAAVTILEVISASPIEAMKRSLAVIDGSAHMPAASATRR